MDARSPGLAPGPLPGLALVAVLFWGASFVAVKIALGSFHPLGLAATRLVLGFVLIAAVQRARGGALFVGGRDLAVCALLGTILAAHLTIQAHGLLRTSAVHTGWIIGFTPVTIAIGAQLVLRERLRRAGWLGVALGTGGVLLVAFEPADLAAARAGDLLQLVSCLTWAAYSILGVGVVGRRGALCVTGVAMAFAAALLIAASAVSGFLVERPGAREIAAVLFLGLLCSGVANAFWYRSQHRHGSHRVGAMLYLEPFVTLAMAKAVLDEPFGWQAGAGGAIVLVGVWLVGRAR